VRVVPFVVIAAPVVVGCGFLVDSDGLVGRVTAGPEADAATADALSAVISPPIGDGSSTSSDGAISLDAASAIVGCTVQKSEFREGAHVTQKSNGTGCPWMQPDNALHADGLFTTCSVSNGLWAPTYSLIVSDFGFALPTTARLVGVEAQWSRRAVGTIYDTEACLSLGAAQSCTPVAPSGQRSRWATVDETRVFGGPTEMWGTAIGPDQINSSQFGVTLSAMNGAVTMEASVDTARVAVYYCL
jgi:hypothetical protein